MLANHLWHGDANVFAAQVEFFAKFYGRRAVVGTYAKDQRFCDFQPVRPPQGRRPKKATAKIKKPPRHIMATFRPESPKMLRANKVAKYHVHTKSDQTTFHSMPGAGLLKKNC